MKRNTTKIILLFYISIIMTVQYFVFPKVYAKLNNSANIAETNTNIKIIDMGIRPNGDMYIDGNAYSNKSKIIGVKVISPIKSLEYIDETMIKEDGSFNFSFRLKNIQEGEYEIILCRQGDTEVLISYLEYYSAKNESKTEKPNDSDKAFKQYSKIVDKNMNSEVETEVDFYYEDDSCATKLEGGRDIIANFKIKSNSVDSTNLTAVLALYDKDNTLVRYSDTGNAYQYGEQTQFNSAIKLPNKIQGYKLKAFVVKGNDILESFMQPVSDIFIISDSNKNYSNDKNKDANKELKTYSKLLKKLNESSIENKLLIISEPLIINKSLTNNGLALSTELIAGNFEIDSAVVYCNGIQTENLFIEGANVKVKVKVSNYKSTAQDITPLLALYDGNNRMVTSSMPSYVIQPNESRIVETSIMIPTVAQIGALENCKIKLMVWDTIYNMNPLQNAVTIIHGDYFGNQFISATEVNVDSLPINGKIHFIGDCDFLKFTVPSNNTYTLGIKADNDIGFTLYDANHTIIENTDENGIYIKHYFSSVQTYYLKISSITGKIGSYSIYVDDYGSNFETASNIEILQKETLIPANIDYQYDLDFFKFIAPFSGTYTFETNGSTDMYGYLFDSNKIELKRDDDSGIDLNFKYSCDLVGGGIYYIKAKHYSTRTGSYVLKITSPDIPPMYEYQYDSVSHRLKYILKNGKPFVEFIYDENGNLKQKKLITN